jgi:hypothetical protein
MLLGVLACSSWRGKDAMGVGESLLLKISREPVTTTASVWMLGVSSFRAGAGMRAARRTISPPVPSEMTSSPVSRISSATASSASRSPEIAGARTSATASGVKRILRPVLCAMLRSEAASGCSGKDICLACAAPAWHAMKATLPASMIRSWRNRHLPKRSSPLYGPLYRGFL